MKKKHLQNHVLLLFIALLLTMYRSANAQEVKRQCITPFGSVITNNGMLINQTVGQSYNCSSSNSQTILLQGFQQPEEYKTENNTPDLPSNTDVKIYPNPAVNSVNLQCDAKIENPSILITDICGRQVLAEKPDNLTLFTINCENWMKGTYLVTISGDKQISKTFRLVILK